MTSKYLIGGCVHESERLISDKTSLKIACAGKQTGNPVDNSLPSEGSETVSSSLQNDNGAHFVESFSWMISCTTALCASYWLLMK